MEKIPPRCFQKQKASENSERNKSSLLKIPPALKQKFMANKKERINGAEPATQEDIEGRHDKQYAKFLELQARGCPEFTAEWRDFGKRHGEDIGQYLKRKEEQKEAERRNPLRIDGPSIGKEYPNGTNQTRAGKIAASERRFRRGMGGELPKANVIIPPKK